MTTNKRRRGVGHLLERLSMRVTRWTGSTSAFALACAVVLVWLVMRSRRKPNQPTDTTERTERATDDLYREEEQRRREGTDDL